LIDFSSIKKPLTPQDIIKFEHRGYIVVKNAIPISLAQDLASTMLACQKENNKCFQETQDDYAGGIVRMVHHPLQWKLRESPIIYLAFCQLLKESKLWVSLDRGKIVPPASFKGNLQKGFIHWDINTNYPHNPIPLQGLVALTDAVADQGGFQCVPGFHHKFSEWKEKQPLDRDPFHPSLLGLEVVPIEMRAGDLVIWNSLIPHGNGPNLSSNPRIAQIVRMFSCKSYGKNTLQQRLEMWENKLPYNHSALNMLNWDEPALSPLGERLLGICDW